MEENNILITEFMGYEWDKTNEVLKQNNFVIQRSIPNYNSDWNYLMPVVEKIESLGFYVSIRSNKYSNGNTITTIENNNEAWVAGNFQQIQITENNLKISKIQSVYNTVVEFINWYNLQGK